MTLSLERTTNVRPNYWGNTSSRAPWGRHEQAHWKCWLLRTRKSSKVTKNYSRILIQNSQAYMKMDYDPLRTTFLYKVCCEKASLITIESWVHRARFSPAPSLHHERGKKIEYVRSEPCDTICVLPTSKTPAASVFWRIPFWIDVALEFVREVGLYSIKDRIYRYIPRRERLSWLPSITANLLLL